MVNIDKGQMPNISLTIIFLFHSINFMSHIGDLDSLTSSEAPIAFSRQVFLEPSVLLSGGAPTTKGLDTAPKVIQTQVPCDWNNHLLHAYTPLLRSKSIGLKLRQKRRMLITLGKSWPRRRGRRRVRALNDTSFLMAYQAGLEEEMTDLSDPLLWEEV